MSKPMKGVIPAKTAQKPVVEKKESVEDNNAQTLKPIKKAGATKTITIPKENSNPPVKVPSNDEVELLKEILVDKLMAVFVTRDEIKTVVEKTLQEMVASGAKVSDK